MREDMRERSEVGTGLVNKLLLVKATIPEGMLK